MFLKKIITQLSLIFLLFPGLVLAANDFGLTTSAEAANLPKEGGDLMEIVANIIGVALSLIGVIFMILFIYGGFMWMTAGGNPDKTKKAKDIMINVVIGAVLVFSAYFITKFVINELVGSVKISP